MLKSSVESSSVVLSSPSFRMDCRVKPGNDAKKEREAERRETRSPRTEPIRGAAPPPNAPDLAGAHGGGSPLGVPPRHLRQRPNATAQLQFTLFLGRNYCTNGCYPLPAVLQYSGTIRRPVIVPAGRLVPEPPGSGGDEPPRAGTAPAPDPAGVAGRRPVGRDGTLRNRDGDACQGASSLKKRNIFATVSRAPRVCSPAFAQAKGGMIGKLARRPGFR